MATLQTFRNYRISQDRTGGTVELWRSGTEVACLAVDTLRHVFVELHVAVSPNDKPLDVKAFQQLVQLAIPLRHRNLLGVMEGGEDEGAHYYTTDFLDGERFDTWLARCNPLPPWLALHTLSQIIEGLCALAPHPRLLAGVELLNCGITLSGDHVNDLTARICDMGLSAAGSRQPDPRQTEARIIQETGRLLLYMVTGTMQQGPAESLDLASHNIAPELGFLLGSIFMPSMQHHPLTLDQLRTLVDRCSRELSPELAASLRHRHLLGVIEGGEDEGAHYFTTDFLDGERFDTWLARCNPLPPWLALHTLSQIIEGLCALAPHPRLLAGVELLNCGISLAGDHVDDLTARICDMGLSAAAARQPDPRVTEARIIEETGRLLLYMLTGAMQQGPVESLDLASHTIAPELGFLLGSIFMPAMQHHPRTLDQLRTLVDRCSRDLSPELAARPEKVPPAMRPKLPLHAHFFTGAGVADIAGDECTVDTRPFDALEPYRHRATQRATRSSVTIQLLPPARLMPLDYGKLIIQAGENINAQEHPHLLRVLAWDEQEHPEVLLEENPGRWNLDSIVRLKGKLDPRDVALILEQLEAALREAESCGLAPVIRSPRQILVQITAPGGEEAMPPEVELARQPLENWPSFRLKVRTWPLTLNFTQPDRFNPERLIHREPGAVEHLTAARGMSFAQQPTARDYALLSAWMLGGTGEIPERVRPLIYDHLSNRSEAALGGRKEFLDRFQARAAGRPPGHTGPVPAPSRKGPPRGLTSAVPLPLTEPAPLGLEAVSFDGDAVPEAAPGFAEALFGAAKARTSSVPVPVFMPLSEGLEDERTFLDGPLPGLYDEDAGEYDSDLDPPPEPNRLLIWLLVVVTAALLAGVAAHLNGTAFWQR